MRPLFDLESAATDLASVISAITDDQLDAATPCAETTVRDLLTHALGFTEAFRQAATKESIGRSIPPTAAPRTPLPEDWRDRIPAQLKALVEAWREPAAWEGETEAGGVTAPATQMAIFGLNEVIVHGWDLAGATGLAYAPAEQDLSVLREFLRDTPPEGVPGLFGPVVPVAATAPLLDRVIGLTGRDPSWARG